MLGKMKLKPNLNIRPKNDLSIEKREEKTVTTKK